MKNIIKAVMCLLMCVFITGCNSSEKMEDKVISEIPIDSKEFGIEALIDNSIIYQYFGGGKQTYYRYYIETGETVPFETINNFISNTGWPVLLDDKLYFYTNVGLGDSVTPNDVLYGGEYDISENVLFCMDLSDNTMKRYENNDNSIYGLKAFLFNDNIITLKNIVDGDNITTFLEIFNIETETRKKENVQVFNSKENIGEGIREIYADNDFLYVFHEKTVKENYHYETTAKLTIYDRGMREIRSVKVSEEILNCVRGRVEMAVFGEYFFIKNFSFSDDSVLGRITGNSIEPVFMEKELALVINQTAPDNPLLFGRMTNKLYTLDTETGDISTIELKIGNGYSIMNAWADDENMLLYCFKYDDGEGKPNPAYTYFINRDCIGDVLPCGELPYAG